MENEQEMAIGMTSAGNYQVVIAGRLDKGWEDWFNGTQDQLESSRPGSPITTLNCHVRDQSELLGVLNRLNSLNFPIIGLRLLGRKE